MKAQVAFSAALAKVKRHIGFDTREGKETIYDYVQVINDEISKKRREFGLE